jgi:Flp pilus assembly protein TadD
MNPHATETLARHALAARARGDLDTALTHARQALRLAPDAITARHALGLALHDQAHLAEAEDCFRGLLRRDPDAAEAWINLGVLRQKQGDPAEAEACYRTALRHGSGMGAVGGNLGLALLEQARPIEAEAALRVALAERGEDAGITLNLAMALLTQGKLAEAWPAYEARLALDPAPDPGVPALRTLDQAAGARVLVRAEQGFGDTLQFCRYVPMLVARGANPVFEVPGPLRRLMGSLRGVTDEKSGPSMPTPSRSALSRPSPSRGRDRIGEVGIPRDRRLPLGHDRNVTPPGTARIVTAGETCGPIDHHIRLMSLPALFGTGLDTIPSATPYLRADPDDVTAWRRWWEERDRTSPGLAAARRVGLAWAGGSRPDNPHALAIDRRRSIPVAELAPLLAVDDVAFVALNLGRDDAPCHDPTGRIGDFADTAALLETLDLVISVDTAVAHLAGALGRPVWLLNRFDTCWRWLDRGDDSPWYPTLRQFRQTAPGDWTSVIARVVSALRESFPSPA